MFELEGFDREAYSARNIKRIEDALERFLRLGVVQLLQGLESGLKQGSGQLSFLAARRARLQFFDPSITFGYALGGKPMDNDKEIGERKHLYASYDVVTNEVTICGERLPADNWTPEQAKEAVFNAAELQTYTPDPRLYTLFRPSVDNSRN